MLKRITAAGSGITRRGFVRFDGDALSDAQTQIQASAEIVAMGHSRFLQPTTNLTASLITAPIILCSGFERNSKST